MDQKGLDKQIRTSKEKKAKKGQERAKMIRKYQKPREDKNGQENSRKKKGQEKTIKDKKEEAQSARDEKSKVEQSINRRVFWEKF